MIFAIVLLCCLLVAGANGEECYHEGSAHRYRGRKNTTPNNGPCIEWRRYSNEHRIESFPDGSYDAAANYCREPTKTRDKPWCYYNGEGDWAYCSVPKCPAS